LLDILYIYVHQSKYSNKVTYNFYLKYEFWCKTDRHDPGMVWTRRVVAMSK